MSPELWDPSQLKSNRSGVQQIWALSQIYLVENVWHVRIIAGVSAQKLVDKHLTDMAQQRIINGMEAKRHTQLCAKT